tara:strand:- start:9619 stop:10242 length:624 start_codon:yes stop_codon:yes gene_type:complete
MLFRFLNNLQFKPTEYQLLWLCILGQINNNEETIIYIKDLKYKFQYNKSKFYRIINYGLPYFSNERDRVFILLNNGKILIKINKLQSIKKQSRKTNQTTNLMIEEIIDYLNLKTNKNFKINNNKTITLINTRFKEGYTLDDFKKVIDLKSEKWLNTNMDAYLRPMTLFSNKMEGYLNETINKKSNERFTKTQSAVDQAKQIDWFGKR